MDVNFVTGKEAKDLLREKLMSDWVLMIGDDESILALEWEIYTPGTPKNADFEMIGFMPSVVFVGKKTDDLRQWLANPPGFDQLITLAFYDDVERGKLYRAIMCRKDMETCASELASQVAKKWQ